MPKHIPVRAVKLNSFFKNSRKIKAINLKSKMDSNDDSDVSIKLSILTDACLVKLSNC